MQHIESSDASMTVQTEQHAERIRKLNHQEAAELAAAELQRFLDLLETLEGRR